MMFVLPLLSLLKFGYSTCHYQCASCNPSTPSVCTSCNTANLRYDYHSTTQTCPCSAGYYDDGTNALCRCINYLDKACSYECSQCTSASSCVICQTGRLSPPSCLCPVGQYDSGVVTCGTCSYQCQACTGTSIQCTACNGLQRSSLPSCTCNQGYYDSGISDCSRCNYKCVSCTNNPQCTTCYGNRIGLNCDCPSAYYDDGITSTCQQCSFKCENCQGSDTNCISCAGNRIITPSCGCPAGYYDDNTSPSCQICSNKCQSCQSSSNNCIVCKGDRQNPPACSCSSGQFDDNASFFCSTCPYMCLECVSATTCTRCAENRSGLPSCNCPLGTHETVPATSFCPDCGFKCGSCTSSNPQICLTCYGQRMTTPNCNCINGYFEDNIQRQCAKCSVQCATCEIVFDKCLTCANTHNNDPPLCTCPAGSFYYNSLSFSYYRCYSCQPNCATCDYNNNNCTSCNMTLPLRNNSIPKCPCNDGYYDDGSNQVCLPCQLLCQTCQTNTSCLLCIPGRIRPPFCNNGCDYGYYDAGNMDCKKCAIQCQTCSVTATNCTSCDLTHVVGPPVCTCASGYYQPALNHSCFVCDPRRCLTCTGWMKCQSCVEVTTRDVNAGCVCYARLYDDGYNTICSACHQTCLFCNGPDINNCLGCSKELDGRYLNTLTSQCECMVNYYEIGQRVCAPCYYPCYTCTNSSVCTGCASGWGRTMNHTTNICDCLPKQFDKGYQSCVSCHYQCYTCSGNLYTDCLSCDSATPTSNRLDFIALNGTCLCDPSIYDDTGVFECHDINCHYSCDTCSGSLDNQCTSCYKNWVSSRTLNQTSCPCDIGYFDIASQTICGTCAYNCYTCVLNETNCTACAVNRINIPTCICPDGTYEVGKPYCPPCDYPAATCVYNNYTTCAANRIFSLNTKGYTVCSCPSIGYFDDLKSPTCGSCAYQCYQCSLTAINCIVCAADRILLPKCICPDGFYDNGADAVCQLCAPQCLTCTSQSNKCDKCAGNRLASSKPSCICNPGYWDDFVSVDCKVCDVKCSTCEINATNCLSCASNRNNDFPTCSCPIGYYDLNTSATCSICNSNCATCVSSADNCLTCESSHNNDAPTCSCPARYFWNGVDGPCQLCSPRCATCDWTKGNCTSCSPTHNNDNPTCSCPDGFYDDDVNQNCQNCKYRCTTCSTSPNCITCKGLNRLTPPACGCASGYYDDFSNANCVQCPSLCLTCTSASYCLTCADSTRQPQQACPCKDGWYEASPSTLTCPQCHYSCKKCSTSSTQCTECPTSSFRTLQGNSCACNAKYFDNSVATCSPCSYQCATCQGGASQCLTCEPFRLTAPICACQAGYYDISSSNQCLKCKYYCGNCLTTSTNCLSCQGINRASTIPTCPCQNGYFDDGANQNCVQCSFQCLTCLSNSLNCLTCSSNRTNPATCGCPVGSYDAGTSECQICHYTCLTCQLANNNCKTCVSSRELNVNSCPCTQGYYDDGFSPNCQRCKLKCTTCVTSSDNCLNCYSDRVQVTPQCSCNDGLYDDGVNQPCQQCSHKCIKCQSTASNCLECGAKRKTIPDCQCQDGYFDDGSSQACQQCIPKCKLCSGSNSNCVQCAIGYRINLAPTCGCLDGYFDDHVNASCQKCSRQCQTCVNFADNCLSCSVGYYESANPNICLKCNNNCLSCQGTSSNCSECAVGNRQTVIPYCGCSDQYYDDYINPGCLSCSYRCATCNLTANNCLSCRISRIKHPQCLCQDGFYDDGQNPQCQNCSYQCLTCVNKTICLSCDSSRFLQSDKCPCNIGYFDDGKSKQCQKCDYRCVQCLNSGDCTICGGMRLSSPKCGCKDGYYDDGSTQSCLACQKNCLTCEHNSSHCLSCNINRYKEPICSCSDTFYSDINFDCKACQYNCYNCLNFSKCIDCSSQLRNISTNCQCNLNYYEYNKSCLACSPKCLECNSELDTDCLSCNGTLERYLSGKQCLCNDYYYEAEGLCQKCHYSCQHCSGPQQNQCTSCQKSTNRIFNKTTNQCDCLRYKFYDDEKTNCVECIESVWACQIPNCGDGKKIHFEACDDGNTEPRDGCSKDCMVEERFYCEGKDLTKSSCHRCPQNCATCNLTINSELLCQSCNDGYFMNLGNVSCQSCAPKCKVCTSPFLQDCIVCDRAYNDTVIPLPKKCQYCEDELGVYSEQDRCIAQCGDGILRNEFKEECDDGNKLDGDGCSQNCQLETGFKCDVVNMQQTLCTQTYRVPVQIVFNKVGIYQQQRYVSLIFGKPVKYVGTDTSNATDGIKMYFQDDNLPFKVQLLQVDKTDEGEILKLDYMFELKVSVVQKQFYAKFDRWFQFKDSDNHSVVNVTSSLMPTFRFIDKNVKSQTENIQTAAQAMTIGLIVLVCIAVMMGGLSIFWNVLDLLQMFSYMEYINIEYPYNLQTFFGYFSVVQFNYAYQIMRIPLVSNLIGYVIPSEYQLSSKQKLNDNNLSPVFIINLIGISSGWFVTYALYLLSRFIVTAIKQLPALQIGEEKSFIKLKIHQYYLKVILFLQLRFSEYTDSYFYSIIIRTFISTSYDLNFAIMAQTEQLELFGKQLGITLSILLAGLSLLGQILIIGYGLSQMNTKNNHIDSRSIKKLMGAYYDGINTTAIIPRTYNSVLMVKRVLYIGFLICAYQYPFIQIVSVSTILLSFSLFIWIVQPFDEDLEYYKSTTCEAAMGCFSALTMIFALLQEEGDDLYEQEINVGWVCISLFMISLTVQVGTDTYQQFQILKKQYRKISIWIDKLMNKNQSQKTIDLSESNGNDERIKRAVPAGFQIRQNYDFGFKLDEDDVIPFNE